MSSSDVDKYILRSPYVKDMDLSPNYYEMGMRSNKNKPSTSFQSGSKKLKKKPKK